MEYHGTNSPAIDVYVVDLSCWRPHEVYFLTDVHTLSLKLLAEPPHVGASEILVLKYNLYVIRPHLGAIDLLASALVS